MKMNADRRLSTEHRSGKYKVPESAGCDPHRSAFCCKRNPRFYAGIIFLWCPGCFAVSGVLLFPGIYDFQGFVIPGVLRFPGFCGFSGFAVPRCKGIGKDQMRWKRYRQLEGGYRKPAETSEPIPSRSG